MLIIMIYTINFSPFCSPNRHDMMVTGIKQANKILKKKTGRTEEDLWLPELAKTPLHHHAEKKEGQGE